MTVKLVRHCHQQASHDQYREFSRFPELWLIRHTHNLSGVLDGWLSRTSSRQLRWHGALISFRSLATFAKPSLPNCLRAITDLRMAVMYLRTKARLTGIVEYPHT